MAAQLRRAPDAVPARAQAPATGAAEVPPPVTTSTGHGMARLERLGATGSSGSYSTSASAPCRRPVAGAPSASPARPRRPQRGRERAPALRGHDHVAACRRSGAAARRPRRGRRTPSRAAAGRAGRQAPAGPAAEPGQVEVEGALGEPVGQVGRDGRITGRLHMQHGPAARLQRPPPEHRRLPPRRPRRRGNRNLLVPLSRLVALSRTAAGADAHAIPRPGLAAPGSPYAPPRPPRAGQRASGPRAVHPGSRNASHPASVGVFRPRSVTARASIRPAAETRINARNVTHKSRTVIG